MPMTGQSSIIAIGSGSQQSATEEFTPAAEVEAPLLLDDMYEEPENPVKSVTFWAVPALAILTVLGWSLFFGWANRAEVLAGATPLQAIALIQGWAVPVLLICTTWLLAMRNSRREATRFADTARLLRDESSALESRLTTINQELSLAREFIAAQSRDLESLGRVAVERLSQNADRLQGLVRDNGAQVDAIASVSASAMENMDRLRGQLPVIASSAKDVTNNIANAGRVAHAHLEDMVTGFKRINEFGQASERQVINLRGQVESTIGEFGAQLAQMDEHSSARFAALSARGEEFRAQLDVHEVEALTALQSRLNALRDESTALSQTLSANEAEALTSIGGRLKSLVNEAAEFERSLFDRNRSFAEETTKRLQDADARHNEAVNRMAELLSAYDSDISTRRSSHEEQSSKLAAHSEAIAQQMTVFAGTLREVESHGINAEAGIAASLQTLAQRLTASRDALAGTDKAIAELTDNSVRLLELIQASAHHSREEIPGAISVSETRLAALETRIFALRDVVSDAGERGENLSNYVLATRDNLGASLDDLDNLHAKIEGRAASHSVALSQLHQSLQSIKADSAAIAEDAQGELKIAIEALIGAAHDAVAGIDSISAGAIASLAERLGVASGDALDRVLRSRTAEAVGQLEQASAHATGVSREAAMQLRDQLAKVDELTGNLEQRVAQVRLQAEEQVDNDFSRRVALITESLNSSAIDIAKALSTDVTDTAWAAYLRGDRGVFTRRAVRLLDAGDAKSVAQIYEEDRDFREHVSHYIHDFEAMLRQLLSTRDGHALGVTLLSSDMGKLYVVLAQAIERLRN